MPKHLILLATAAATGAFTIEVSSRYPLGVLAGVALYGLLLSLDAIYNPKPELERRGSIPSDCEQEL